MNNKYIGIDIGTYNFAFTIDENSCYKHIHINFNNSKLSLFEIINLIINNFNFKNNYIIKIENQLKSNIKCIIIQTILETILNMNNIKYILINPKIKYKQLKSIYNNFNKKDLKNYININLDNCFYYIINYKLIESVKIDKMDDIIDSLLICLS